MTVLGSDWNLFLSTVEGRESIFSSVIIDGALCLSTQAVPYGTAVNPNLLIDLFKSDIVLPREIRNWLAELVDPEGQSEIQCLLKKRGPGRLSRAISANWDAAEYFEELPESKNRQTRIHETYVKFKISKTSLEAAIASLKAARLAQEKVLQNEREI